MQGIQKLSSLSLKALSLLSHKYFTNYQWNSKISDDLKKNDFLFPRHVGLTEKEISDMLKEFQCKTLDELMMQIVPKNIYDPTSLHYQEGDVQLEPALTESEFLS